MAVYQFECAAIGKLPVASVGALINHNLGEKIKLKSNVFLSECEKLQCLLLWCVDGCLTGSGCFTDEGDQVVLDLGKSIIIVDHEHMSLTGLAADKSQL